MFSSLKRLLGRDEKFYDLLEASAEESRNSATLLAQLMRRVSAGDVASATNNDLLQSRRRHKRIAQEITELLCKNFVTPLEREDLDALSGALYRVPKSVEKVGERLIIFPLAVRPDKIAAQVALLEQATEAVSIMVRSLRKHSHGENLQQTYERLQTIEGDADKLMTDLLRDLYNGDIQAKEMMILKDVYEMLEKVIDRCRDAGNIVFQIVLKYS